MPPDKIECTNETSGCLDLGVALKHGDVLGEDGLTLSRFVGNDF